MQDIFVGVPSLPFTILFYFIKNLKIYNRTLAKIIILYLFIKHLNTKQKKLNKKYIRTPAKICTLSEGKIKRTKAITGVVLCTLFTVHIST